MSIEKVSVIGLGKLGSCIAAVLAYKGYEVVGVDIDREKVEKINSLEPPVYEPGLADILKAIDGRLKATTEIEEAISNTQATFIVVPTPSLRSGRFSLEYVKKAISSMAGPLKRKEDYHLVVLNSTVSPGSLGAVIKPLLEKRAGKKCGDDIGLCYNPEFIALGNVIEGLLKPDLVLIGESDSRAGELLERVYHKVCENNPPIERMSFINAEIVKIAINSFVTMKISFANTLAEICENVPEGDVDVVTRAIGNDSRVGHKYLKGALGYGGPCFPRDNRAFAEFGKRVGVKTELALATDKVNARQIDRVLKVLKRQAIEPPARIAVLGLAYKPGTNVTEESQGVALARRLIELGYDVVAYDPVVSNNEVGEAIVVTEDLRGCLNKAKVVIIATPWKEFEDLPYELLRDKIIIIDCWRIFRGKEWLGFEDIKYIALGIGM